MPTIKRRRRAQRTRISDAMIEILWSGGVLVSRGEPVFENEAHERQVWNELRHMMLAEYTRPGKRPFAFYKFELKELPRHHWQEIDALERHGLLSAEEKVAIENIHGELHPNQGHLFSSYLDPEFILRRGGSRFVRSADSLQMELHGLKCLCENFQFAAGWHERRSRPSASEKYARLAESVNRARDIRLAEAAKSEIVV